MNSAPVQSALTNGQRLVKGIAARVQDFLKEESSGHDWEHIRRVWTNAKTIAAQENAADSLLVELAALLHDVDDWKITGTRIGSSHQNASAFLKAAQADQALIDSVCRIIGAIDYRGSITASRLESLEDRIVHDADKLDAIGAIGIGRCFAFGGKFERPMFLPDIPPPADLDEKRYADISRTDNTTINHFFDKLLRLKDRMATKTGRRMALDRHETMVTFLRAFFREQSLHEWEERLDHFLREQNRAT